MWVDPDTVEPVMFDTILVPVDDTPESERIIPVVVALAQAVGAGIEFLTADSPNTDAGTMAVYHQRLAEGLPPGVSAHGRVLLGDAPVADLLLDAYRERPRAILALATRAPGSLWQWLGGGSVGDEVVQDTLRPVLLAGPRCEASASAALGAHATAALDGSAVDDDVLAAAIDWCRALGSPLTLVRAVLTPAEFYAHADAAADLELRAETARHAGVEVAVRVIDTADAGRAVLRAATAAGGVLVVGSHRRGPLGRVVHGSNALWLTHRSPIPVLVAGFTTALQAAEAEAGFEPDVRPATAPGPCELGVLLGWGPPEPIAMSSRSTA